MSGMARVWLYADAEPHISAKTASLTLTLHGAKGDVALANLEQSAPSRGRTFDRFCEHLCQVKDIGALHAVTVAYRALSNDCKPWMLGKIVVRISSTGMVDVFRTRGVSLEPDTSLHMQADLTWHEDEYGNQSASPIASRPLQWPGSLIRDMVQEMGRDGMRHQLREACLHEVLHSVDAVLSEQVQRRTPGTAPYVRAQATQQLPQKRMALNL
mmetsp:Transcript_59794/g.129612  ORF Transcript_59794/g.129612 Transcript_59794/m.129612 type:complete len:213 (+) Transcript_59794:240-878(+)